MQSIEAPLEELVFDRMNHSFNESCAWSVVASAIVARAKAGDLSLWGGYSNIVELFPADVLSFS